MTSFLKTVYIQRQFLYLIVFHTNHQKILGLRSYRHLPNLDSFAVLNSQSVWFSFEEKLRVLRVAVENVHDTVIASYKKSLRKGDNAFNPEPISWAASK